MADGEDSSLHDQRGVVCAVDQDLRLCPCAPSTAPAALRSPSSWSPRLTSAPIPPQFSVNGWMTDELEKLLERVKVPVAMKKRVLPAQAECRDQTVDGLANRVTAASKRPIVPRGLARHRHAARVEHLQVQKPPLNLLCDNVIPDALQHFAEDDVGQPKTLAVELCVQPVRLGILHALKVIDPDGGVDDDHALLRHPFETGCVDIPLPGHLTSQMTDAGLAFGLDQQTQSLLRPPRASFGHRCCAWPAASGDHRYRCWSACRASMCKNLRFLCISQFRQLFAQTFRRTSTNRSRSLRSGVYLRVGRHQLRPPCASDR